MRCPNCKEGYIQAFSKIMPLRNCDICHGTGELPEGMEYNPARGSRMKADRRNVHKLTIRTYCLEYGIDAAERSAQERGFFKKEGAPCADPER